MYKYTAFGLQIASEPELPGLMPGTGNPDVIIRFGVVPVNLPEPIKGRGVAYELNDNSFLLKVPGIARFLVTMGNEITIERDSGSDDIDLSLFTINTPIGALLYQRGYFPMHASAIEINGGCAIFTGVSGVGKSTILASLHQQGYHVVADEICAISLSGNGEPHVHPGAAYTWLWRDVLDHFGTDTATLTHRHNNPEKYKLPIDARFFNTNLPLKRVYILDTKNTPGIEMVEIKGSEKLKQIIPNAYRYRIGNTIHNPMVFFNLSASISKYPIVRKITRPPGNQNIDLLREYIINDLESE
jgi:hypothetical protein